MPIVISGTNGISGVDGTASNPSYEGTDANTGVFFPAADTVAIATNGTEALRVNSSQNVGVGITPSSWGSGRPAIEMAGSTQGNLAFNGTGRSGLVITNAYHDGSSWRYKNTGFSSAYAMENGANAWYSAPSGTAGNVAVYTQLVSVEAGKSVALEGATSQTGIGITFPATQVASSNVNTLDDYEEGTWIPTVRGSTTEGTTTYGNRTGTYIKIGRQVTCWFRVGYSAATGTGALLVTGLPFAIQAGANAAGAAMSGNLNWPISGSLSWYAPDNQAYLELYVSSDDGNYTAVAISNEVADMIGTITYFVS